MELSLSSLLFIFCPTIFICLYIPYLRDLIIPKELAILMIPNIISQSRMFMGTLNSIQLKVFHGIQESGFPLTLSFLSISILSTVQSRGLKSFDFPFYHLPLHAQPIVSKSYGYIPRVQWSLHSYFRLLEDVAV